MSWLANRLGIHMNLRPLAAPAGGILGGMIGGPFGAALGAGLFKTADNKAHGDSWGHAIGQGALNAGIAGLSAGGLDKIKAAFGGGGSAAGAFVPSSSAPLTAAEDLSGLGRSGPAFAAGAGAGSGGGGGILSGLGAAAKGVGSFVKENPMAASMGLQGLGQIGQMGSENAYRDAQTRAQNAQTDQLTLDRENQKRRSEALMSLLQSFGGGQPYQSTNPYRHGVA